MKPQFREFMLEQGGQSVATVYQPYRRPPNFTSSLIFLGVLIGVAVGVGTKTYVVYNKVLYSWMFLWLDYTDKVKPQQKSEFLLTVKQCNYRLKERLQEGYMPYEYKGDPEKAGKFLVNPADHSTEVLAQGKKLYNIYCTACHGTYGDGDGKSCSERSRQRPQATKFALHEIKRMARWKNLPCN